VNKIIIYIILLVSYLSLNRAIAPDNLGLEYIRTSQDLSKIIKHYPATAILERIMTKGYIIKTYYQKYKIVYAHRSPREIIVRTRRRFAEQSKRFVGMSLFSIDEDKNINTIPMPPGIIFINNQKFGQWYFKSAEYFWKFYRSYRRLPIYLGWGSFRPSKEFYEVSQESTNAKLPYFGLDNQFGAKGEITLQYLPRPQKHQLFNSIKFGNLFKRYLKTNYN